MIFKALTNFWRPKYSVCKECGVHFEPVVGYESRWGYLCTTHRKPVMERDQKREAVIAWASGNWERLAEMMEKETADRRAAYDQLPQALIKNIALAQTNQSSSAYANGMTGLDFSILHQGLK